MVADYRIARSDEAADLADEERAEWIAERAAELEVEYAADVKKVEDAMADFFLADEGSLVTNLSTFFSQIGGNPATLAHWLHDVIKQQIAPILREYAEDAATEERNRMEIAADVEKFEQRSAA
jgi:hypothetical protein